MLNCLSLPLLVFSPLIAFAVILSPLFGDNEVYIRRFAKGFASLHFLYTLLFVAGFDAAHYGMSYQSELKIFDIGWLDTLGISASFGVDGLSLLLVVLTSFVFLLSLIISKSTIRSQYKFYYSMMFLLQCAILGVFCARDMFLFFLFWELELIPMYFLIANWGSGNSKKSAMKFILYTFLGSIFMLFGMLILYFYSFAANSTLTANMEMLDMSESLYPFGFQFVVFLAFLIGFAVKIPIIPFHTWLPDAHSDAPTPVSMMLAAILLKMGVYGIIRFNVIIFPEIFKIAAPVLMVFAVINIVAAALISYAQKDIKKLIAYSSISHMGIVLLGICALNQIGLDGAIFQMLAHGFISAGLFALAGVIYFKCKTRDLTMLGGVGRLMPRVMVFALIICLAALGLPLLAGFPGELMSFIGAFTSGMDNVVLPKVCAFISIFALVLSASYILKMLHGVFYGTLPNNLTQISPTSKHQLFVLFVLSITIIIFGCAPGLLIDLYSSFSSIVIDMLRI